MDQAENYASEAVDCFRRFIDILRSEFPPPSIKTTTKDDKIPLLFSRVVQVGLVKHVQEITENTKSLGDSFVISTRDISEDDERYRLVHELILPLLQALTSCYRILDEIPEPQRHDKNKKPSPPPGMLSIQNYTDIACVLEFTICTSILPKLESNILAPIPDRIRLLPKSLAGRLPRESLKWAAAKKPSPNDALELLQTTQVVASLILLDRFRPMLLPRHMADLYAAIFQAEHLQATQTLESIQQQYSTLYTHLGLTKNESASRIDAHWQAKAYQLLLLQGVKAPSWLRQRVSILLTKLACRQLPAILHVFVPLKEPSAPGQRLGQALVGAAQGEGVTDFVQQIVLVLQESNPVNGVQDQRQVANCLTMWALLYQLPRTVVMNHWQPLWGRRILSGAWVTATTRQVGALVSRIPPATQPATVLSWLLLSPVRVEDKLDGSIQPTLLSQLLRVASMTTVLESTAKQEALMTLRWFTKAMCESTISTKEGKLEGSTVLAMALVYSMAPTSWDLAGYRYARQSNGTSAIEVETVIIEHDQDYSNYMSIIAGDIANRAAVLVEGILGALDGDKSSDEVKEDLASRQDDDEATRGLPSRLFRLLLGLYLSTSTLSIPSVLPTFLCHDSFRVVSMTLLPLLCEKCPPEKLLLGDRTDATGVLSMVKLVLVCAQSRLETTFVNGGGDSGVSPKVSGVDDWKECGRFLQGVFQENRSSLTTALSEAEGDNDETILSIASIVLSMLIAVLELGSTSRSLEEEALLESFQPVLKPLAELGVRDSIATASNGDSLVRDEARSGMADMAGYAMALIASRKAPAKSSVPEKQVTAEVKLTRLVAEVEEDLQSTQPPIRARGMVSLGRLARGYLGTIQEEDAKTPLIVELDESGSTQRNPAEFLMKEILRLSTTALSDPESYVYLAAIQAIVAAGDMRPREVLSEVALAVSAGVLRAGSDDMTKDMELSNEQRVKMAESLMFIIRRRATTDQFVPFIIDSMVFGSRERIGTQAAVIETEITALIQTETHNYFMRVGNHEEMEDETLEERRAEQDVRLKTGGPIFAAEEADVVRAARVMVLAETVALSTPAVVAPFCPLLVRLAVDILIFERSRPVSRAGSLLAREIYGVVLREQHDMVEALENLSSQASITIEFAKALVSSGEGLLFVTLQRLVSNESDLSDLRSSDNATAARCTEAMQLRELAQEGGIMSAARLSVSESEGDRSPQILRLANLNESTDIKVDALNAMG